jgi:hypothetical protein
MDVTRRAFRTELEWAARVLVFAGLMFSAVPIDARQEDRAPASGRQGVAAREVQAPVNVETQSAEETRNDLHRILEQYAPSIVEVFKHDPSLLSNESYLATYPALAQFLARHPEVAHNPGYFFGGVRLYDWRPDPKSAAVDMWRDVAQGLIIFSVFLVVTGILAWLVRTLLEYRRWLRLSRVQTEVHTKLLDRLTANEDLLAYIQSPTGKKFLESAPIPVDAGPRSLSAPVGRILWSVQAGVVLAAGGFGLLYVSSNVVEDVAPAIFAMGVLAVAFGAGFVASAGIAYLLSQRLGLLEASSKAAE